MFAPHIWVAHGDTGGEDETKIDDVPENISKEEHYKVFFVISDSEYYIFSSYAHIFLMFILSFL